MLFFKGKKINIINQLKAIEELITSILIVIILSLVFLQVLTRSVFTFSFYWLEELVGFLFVYLSIIGASLALRYDDHSSIDLLTRKLNTKGKAICNLIGIVIVIVVLVAYIWGGIIGTQLVSIRTSASLNISWAYIYMAFPLGMALILEQFIRMFLKAVKELINLDNRNDKEHDRDCTLDSRNR